jgi:hypothetical protein
MGVQGKWGSLRRGHLPSIDHLAKSARDTDVATAAAGALPCLIDAVRYAELPSTASFALWHDLALAHGRAS